MVAPTQMQRRRPSAFAAPTSLPRNCARSRRISGGPATSRDESSEGLRFEGKTTEDDPSPFPDASGISPRCAATHERDVHGAPSSHAIKSRQRYRRPNGDAGAGPSPVPYRHDGEELVPAG